MSSYREWRATRSATMRAWPTALLIVHYQRDFLPPGGALAVAGGDGIAGRINALARDDAFALVVATRDWHPPDHRSFREQGGPWPRHCVQGTPGAELSPQLDRSRIAAIVDAGVRPQDDGYSGFETPRMLEVLREHGITAVTVVGLATETACCTPPGTRSAPDSR